MIAIDITHVDRFFDQGIVITEGLHWAIGCCEGTLGLRKTIAKDSQNPYNHTAGLTNGLHGLEAAAAGADQVFYDQIGRTRLEFSFDQVLTAMCFGFRTHVNEWEAEVISQQSTVWDTGGGYPGNRIKLPKGAGHFGQLTLEIRTNFRMRKYNSVITINW